MMFKARLATLIEAKNNNLCLGIDPHASSWPACWQDYFSRYGNLRGVEAWACGLIEVAAPMVPAIKFQSAMFEALGEQGFGLLKKLIAKAKKAELFTLWDGKRGDIGSTMQAYGRTGFDYLQADAMTVQPYLGFDVLTALRPWLEDGFGAYVVWQSSNPAGERLQGPMMEWVYQHFVTCSQEAGLDEGWGLVLGAGQLERVKPAIWEEMAKKPLLLPGCGEQAASPSRDKVRSLQLLGSPLFPLSRFLTGIGQSQAADKWQACRTLDAYQGVFADQLQQLAKVWQRP